MPKKPWTQVQSTWHVRYGKDGQLGRWIAREGGVAWEEGGDWVRGQTCLPWTDACQDEPESVWVEAVSVEHAPKVIIGSAVKQAVLRARAAWCAYTNLRENFRCLHSHPICPQQELRDDGTGAVAELAAGHAGVRSFEFGGADLTPGAFEENLKASCHPVRDWLLFNKPQVTFVCMNALLRRPPMYRCMFTQGCGCRFVRL